MSATDLDARDTDMIPPTPVRRWSAMPREALARFFPLLLLLVLCTVFSLLSPRFLTVGNAMIVAQQAVVLLVTALGMTFVIVAGSIDLSVGAVVALSALAAASTS